MDHVAGSGNAIKFAVRNILMEPRRLLIDVDDPISLASARLTFGFIRTRSGKPAGSRRVRVRWHADYWGALVSTT